MEKKLFGTNITVCLRLLYMKFWGELTIGSRKLLKSYPEALPSWSLKFIWWWTGTDSKINS